MSRLKTSLRSFLAAFVVMLGTAGAQSGTIPVTASHIVDSTGSPLASGVAYFAPVDTTGNPLSYHMGGMGQTLSRPVSATVTNGSFSTRLADTSLTSPLNVCYSVSIIDNNTGQNILGGGYSCAQPSSAAAWCAGGSCNFDNYTPILNGNGIVYPATISLGTVTTGLPGLPGSATFTGIPSSQILNLVLPQGPQGPIGAPTSGVNLTPPSNQSVVNPPGTFTGFNAPSLVNNLLTTNATGSQILRAWGNSQTQGYGLPGCTTLTCHPTTAWPAVFASQMGWTLDNQAYGSSDCADLTYQGTSESMWDPALAITTNSRNIYGHFRNDQSQYGPLPYRVDFARGCIEAETAWLAIPETQKYRASGGYQSRTGTWTDGTPNAAASETLTPGATMTFYVTGKTAYIVTARTVSSTSPSYTIAVDPSNSRGFSVYDPTTKSYTFSQGMDVGTPTGFPISEVIIPYMIRISGLEPTTHAITYTCTTVSTTPCIVFFAAGVSPDNSTANGPFVYSLSPVNNANAEQTGYMVGDTTSLYYDEWNRIISELASDGLQVIGLDATNFNSVYNPNTESQADGVHPTVAGHASIAAAMVSKATAASTPMDRSSSKGPNAISAYDGFGAGQPPSTSGNGSQNTTYLLPKGFLWSSTGPFTGRVYLGYDGAGYIERTADDPTGAVGFGTGRIFDIDSPDGIMDNWFVPGQSTSYQLKVMTSVVQGNGLKHQRITLNPTTTNVIGAFSDTALVWTAAFSDTNYTNVCTLENGNAQASLAIWGKTATGFTIRMTNTGAATNAGLADCIAMHD